MKLNSDLREFIKLLNSRKIRYLVVGGHAVAFHGYPRFTADIDFLIKPSPENAGLVAEAIKDFGFGDQPSLRDQLTQSGKILQLGRQPNRIDLITSISGLDFDEAWEDSVAGELDGLPVRFPSRDSLLRNKRASGRAKDLADVEELERVAQKESG
ncbi:MAG TPA: hypothetical protein VLU25_02105 [Acidobacteriota bacterium]|nr:hypothetical protein [Acidobacteriota bacterium]